MEKKSNKKLIMYIIVSILIISIGVTLAYWIAGIQGEGTPMTFKAANLKIVFTDSDALTINDIKPGWSTTKTFSVENESNKSYKYNIIIKEMANTFVAEKGLQYKITSTNGYNMTDFKDVPKGSGKAVLAYNVNVPAETIQNYTIEFRYFNDESNDQSEDMGKTFSGTLFIEEGTEDPNLVKNKILSDHSTVLTRNNFDSIVGTETATEGTIYKTTEEWETEDGSEVYYFSGNVKDNWVKFGRDSSNADLYWRIIRTNEDGSVRLLYAGTSPSTTSGYISTTNKGYNKRYNNTMYAGYMYGTTGSLENNRSNTTDSTIKTEIDTWYANGLNVKTDTSGKVFDSYVSKTAIYCNDRSTVNYKASGYMYYGVHNRLYHNSTDGRKATYKCGYNPVDIYCFSVDGSKWESTAIGMHANASVADKFSVDKSSGGNGDLTYPVGLMTADEIAYAGGKWATQSPYAYYYLNSANGSVTGSRIWWTMSPRDFNNDYAFVFIVGGLSSPGSLSNNSVNNTPPVARPVVSLKSCARVSGGNGTSSSPYEVSIDETCSSAVN